MGGKAQKRREAHDDGAVLGTTSRTGGSLCGDGAGCGVKASVPTKVGTYQSITRAAATAGPRPPGADRPRAGGAAGPSHRCRGRPAAGGRCHPATWAPGTTVVRLPSRRAATHRPTLRPLRCALR
ncbi:hypothetical protein G6F63_015236 [Rhizopus arrhizus]|nr:hypothetical protein G6F63_015236 [Rhizopus arrhizus]